MSPNDRFRFQAAALGVAVLIWLKASFDRVPRASQNVLSIFTGVIAAALLAGAYLQAAVEMSPIGLMAICTTGLFLWMCWRLQA